MRRMLLMVAGCLTIIGCVRGLDYDEYVEVHKSAKLVLPWAVQIEELFGDADHFITHYRFPDQKTNTWNTVVYFGGRYVLTMQIEVLVDYKDRRIRPVGKPAFFLWEVSRVDVSPDGRIGGSYSRDIRFGENEWKKICDSKGDFSTVKMKLLSSPVPNFDAMVTAERRPLFPISLLSHSLEGPHINVVDSKIVKEDVHRAQGSNPQAERETQREHDP